MIWVCVFCCADWWFWCGLVGLVWLPSFGLWVLLHRVWFGVLLWLIVSWLVWWVYVFAWFNSVVVDCLWGVVVVVA